MFRTLLCAPFLLSFVWASDNVPKVSAEQSLHNLRQGNERFVKGKPKVWDSGHARREVLVAGQSPYACIITCSDSRVPPEQIFDAGLGELFVIRVAGNVTPTEVLASADYAVGHLHCPVVVVMGHTKCGAVAAALADSDFPEPLNSLVSEIRPRVDACLMKGYGEDDLFHGVIKENAQAGASQLISGSRSIEQAVADGRCVVLSAVYDIESGEVSWQSQLSSASLSSEENKNSLSEKKSPTDGISSDKHRSVAKTEKAESDSQASRKSPGSKTKH